MSFSLTEDQRAQLQVCLNRVTDEGRADESSLRFRLSWRRENGPSQRVSLLVQLRQRATTIKAAAYGADNVMAEYISVLLGKLIPF